MTVHRRKADVVWGSLIMICGAAIVLFGVFVLAMQLLHWLKDGNWVAFEFRRLPQALGSADPWPYPALNWKGVEEIARWLYDLPLCIISTAAGFTLLCWGALVAEG